MSVRSPRLWIAVLAAAAVVLVAVADLGRSAPGPVAAVHARVEALHEGRSCRQCHGGLFSDMSESCQECHAPVAAQLDGGKGVHGRLGKERGGQCALCHSEHHGADFALVNQVAFAQAGLGAVETFDHDLVGFAMRGAHLDLDCAACHTLAWTDVLPAGERRFQGLLQRCSACHFDAHEGRMQVTCTSCHGQDDFRDLEAAGHEAQLPLIGGHGHLDCRACHRPGQAHSLDAVGERRAPAQRTCRDCHASPHAAGFVERGAPLAAEGERALPRSADACAACHRPDHGAFADAAAALTPTQHAASGFELAAPHDGAACAQCHAGTAGPDGAAFASRFLGRGQDDCGACHEDPHGGQFDASPLAAGACVACHAATHFTPHLFDVARHAEAALPLAGRHAAAACDACHLQPAGFEPRRFRGTTTTCDGCHADAHDDFFAPALAKAAPVPHGACAHCHVPTSFADVPRARFDHGAWTGHPLAGSHAEAECGSCHARAAAPDAHHRTFGRVATRFPPQPGCSRCHQDPHGGRFDGTGQPPVVAGRTGCARCHDEVSFRSLPHGFDHGRWTGFALDGSHARVECSGCHAPLREATDGGRTWRHAAGRECAACHADPHGGQFAQHGRVDCARCHRPTHFRALVFNHNLDARFPLGDAHGGVECAGCHRAEPIGGAVMVRYRPLPRTCVECHGVHEEQLRRHKRRRG